MSDHSPVPGDLALPDHYRVDAEIGRGGMGTVYRAHDLKHDRTVAIKVLRPEIARTFGRDRFLREIRTAARLMHPNIVTVFDSGETDGTLYFVMPYVPGISLRERLKREAPLSVGEAVAIARQIANALQYAHSQDVVHRDIKPENILLSEGHAWLVDFGVARAVAGGASTKLTATGLILGSPLYLSPEQTRDEQEIDGRADIYSLGCVLYEMLSGAPPFVAETAQGVLMRHLTETPQPLTATRPNVPAALDTVVRRALMKAPGERFRSAGEFESALAAAAEAGSGPPPDATRWLGLRPRLWRVAAAIGAAALPLLLDEVRNSIVGLPDWMQVTLDRSRVELDTTRYVVLPVAIEGQLPDLDAENRLADALSAWQGIDVVDRSVFADLVATAGQDIKPRLITKRTQAGRFVMVTLSRKADSVRVYAELADGRRPDLKLAKWRGTLPLAAETDRVFAAVVDSLLLSGAAPDCLQGNTFTRVLSAVRACDRAFSALADGDIADADTALQEALNLDPSYSRAALWLAEIRSWIVPEPPDVRPVLAVATANASRLSPRESGLLEARRLIVAQRAPEACAVYRSLLAQNSEDYVAWLGLGECHFRDRNVVPDRRSRSGWSFRSSYHRAVLAYSRALEIHPQLMAGYRDRSFAVIRRLFMTSTTNSRDGREATGGSTRFRAYVTWNGDSLETEPWPEQAIALSNVSPGAVAAAADHQSSVLRNLMLQWSRRYPESSAASEGLSVSLELAADQNALTTLRRARSLCQSPADCFRLATNEVWLGLKLSMPADTLQLRRTQRLADSLLRKGPNQTPEQLRSLSSLAMLTGDVSEAARLARLSVVTRSGQEVPAGVLQPAMALQVFASAGGPVDSILAAQRQFESALRNSVSPDRQHSVRAAHLTWAVMMAFPLLPLPALEELGPTGAFTEAEAAFERGDTAKAGKVLHRIAQSRDVFRPADITLDGLYIEAWLLHALGRSSEAIARLDPTLEAIRWFPPGRLEEIPRVGALMRTAIFRARLAREHRDLATARRWTAALRAFPKWEARSANMDPQRRPGGNFRMPAHLVEKDKR